MSIDNTVKVINTTEEYQAANFNNKGHAGNIQITLVSLKRQLRLLIWKKKTYNDTSNDKR
jgi:hypothetical protein